MVMSTVHVLPLITQSGLAWTIWSLWSQRWADNLAVHATSPTRMETAARPTTRLGYCAKILTHWNRNSNENCSILIRNSTYVCSHGYNSQQASIGLDYSSPPDRNFLERKKCIFVEICSKGSTDLSLKPCRWIWVTMGLGKALLPVRCQAITRTSADSQWDLKELPGIFNRNTKLLLGSKRWWLNRSPVTISYVNILLSVGPVHYRNASKTCQFKLNTTEVPPFPWAVQRMDNSVNLMYHGVVIKW